MLGITLFKLTSDADKHVIDVDGKSYQGKDLDSLLFDLTQLEFPVEPIAYWIKALPFSEDDQIDDKNGLPNILIGNYHSNQYKVTYSGYKAFQGVQMPTKISVKHPSSTIKLSINKWVL